MTPRDPVAVEHVYLQPCSCRSAVMLLTLAWVCLRSCVNTDTDPPDAPCRNCCRQLPQHHHRPLSLASHRQWTPRRIAQHDTPYTGWCPCGCSSFRLSLSPSAASAPHSQVFTAGPGPCRWVQSMPTTDSQKTTKHRWYTSKRRVLASSSCHALCVAKE